MYSTSVVDREAVFAAYADYDAACATLATLTYTSLTLPELLELQSRRETQARRAPTVDHALLAEIQTRTTAKDIGAKDWADVLVHRLRISRTEARRRVAEAHDLGPRTTLNGDALAPLLPDTAAAQATGQINAEHVAIIRNFINKPPIPLDDATIAHIDTDLTRIAIGNTPETLRRSAERIAFHLNQDGEEPVEDRRARRRGITLGPQDADGLRKVTGFADAELSSYLEAIDAKFAAPGKCNPDDENPDTEPASTTDEDTNAEPSIDEDTNAEPPDDTPDTPIAAQPADTAETKTNTETAESKPAAATKDTRTLPQRRHDAWKAVARAMLASGNLGQHNGLPVTVVVSTTLRELQTGTGIATTGGHTALPMSDVIRMASHANHYLVIFDDHHEIPLYLGRTKRIATPGQRIVLYARDRGCTVPGCTGPAYHAEAHHARADFVAGGRTDITDLTLACGPQNRLVTDNGWTTRIRPDGRVEWIPPPLLDTGQDRINHYWHPEELFHPPEEDDP